ncbi:fibronectin type III domain-containing protein [Oceanobacillus kimchii]|uniref:Fibronectin type-III domain-containing protein n=1 Tax=Oceanobacillus kimchii TaxID=746691 RepID=A0ABQ5TNK1_9BACI|nr:fibronectin type III domain-containing protein [Oceanobacillus kimchii]GLO66132.1 hypothetical protein MACH08_19160 [Oceanobacillus kimchii]
MATTYNVYRDGGKIASNLTEKLYTDTNLTPNTTYEYQVSAQNETGESELSEAISVTTNDSVPEEPQGLNSTGNTDTEVDLEWQ